MLSYFECIYPGKDGVPVTTREIGRARRAHPLGIIIFHNGSHQELLRQSSTKTSGSGGGYYGGDFTHGFDTQNYPKLQASLGTQPENTHGIQRQTQPNPYPWIFSGRVIPMGTRLKFLPLGTRVLMKRTLSNQTLKLTKILMKKL